jgi:hypothetical protein
VSKLYVYREGVDVVLLVDAKLACVTDKARKVMYSQRGKEALRF